MPKKERTMRKRTELALVPEDHSFEIESETDLLNAFSEKDQNRVLLPHGNFYPIRTQHYLAWRENSGNYVYIVFKKPRWKRPMGLVFKRPTSTGDQVGARHCDWCLSYGGADQVSILGLQLNSRQSLGLMLCSDLGCAGRLETISDLSGKNFEKLIGQLYERIGKLFDSVILARTRDLDSTLGDVH